MLEPKKKLPSSLKWNMLSRSQYVADDTVLRHIPYVGDADTKLDFLNDLYANYESSMVNNQKNEKRTLKMTFQVFDEDVERYDSNLFYQTILEIVKTCMKEVLSRTLHFLTSKKHYI